jgi:hypothetical protein
MRARASSENRDATRQQPIAASVPRIVATVVEAQETRKLFQMLENQKLSPTMLR